MDFKQNGVSVSASSPKCSSLVQPLISISKASTPIRTRVITGTLMHPHSSPISLASAGLNVRSPGHNKENTQCNVTPNHNKCNSLLPLQGAGYLNLSPILALNRKIQAGFKSKEHFRGLESGKCTAGTSQNNPWRQVGAGKTNLAIKTSKEYQLLSSHNLRASNSFKSLIESRCKTPNRVQTPICNSLARKSSTPQFSLKDSLMSRNWSSIGQDKLHIVGQEQGDNFEPSDSLGIGKYLMSPRAQAGELKCRNNDMKKAKYKLINRDNGLAEPVYYCSKCTITLVQEGYSVEQLTQEELRGLAIADHPFKVMAEVDQNHKSNRNSNSNNNNFGSNTFGASKSPTGKQTVGETARHCAQLRQRVTDKIQRTCEGMEQRRREMKKRLDDVDCYYNSVIEFMDQQRVKDRENIILQRQEVKKAADVVLQRLEKVLKELQTTGHGDWQDIEELFSTQLTAQQFKQYDVQKSIDQLVTVFEKSLHPCFDPKTPVEPHGLRFSFEMALNQNYKRNSLNCDMKTLEEEDQEEEGEETNLCDYKYLDQSASKYWQGQQEQMQHWQGQQGQRQHWQGQQGHGHIGNGAGEHYEQNAFRNLFPEDEQELSNRPSKQLHSPTFKQF